MTACPHCGEEIESLNHFMPAEEKSCFTITKDGKEHYEHSDFIADVEGDTFECPECSEPICKDEEDAVLFLKGLLMPKKAYLAAGGNFCPFCKSKDIDAKSFDGAGQEVNCRACEKTWTDVYELVDIQFDTK